ncbi:MAG: BatD family protein [Bacteroidales bacterium]|nr:BatD family protein [Bacteroidales bacterium]
MVLIGSAFAQEIRVEAPSTAYANSPFQVKVMVSGGDFSDFKDPQFSGLRVMGRGSMTQIVNWKKSQGFTYTVMAESEGTATIGAASCVINGTRYSTQPRQIKIEAARPQQQQQRRRSPYGSMFDDDDEDPFEAMHKQMQQMMQQMDPYANAAPQQPTYDPAGKNDADAIFAKISINKNNPYKGEQVILTYKIYTRIDFSLTSGFHAPEKKGFWSENLLLDQKYIKPQQETINGKRYITYELGREALYAQEDGSLKIDVMDLPIQAVFYTSQPINIGFFTIQASRPDPQQITLKTNPLNVNVKHLPSGAPQSFDGAVGTFSISGGVDKDKTRVNEAITYSLTIKGQGNLTLIDNPTVNFPNIFEAYDPDVEDNVNRTANGISGSRTFKWVLIPRSEGVYEIPEFQFAYFDPSTGKYETRTVEAQKITIEKGDPKLMQNSSSDDHHGVKEDINYIKTPNATIQNSQSENKRSTHLWFWIVETLVILLALASYIFWRHRQEANKDIAGVRLRRATREAKKRLRRAEKHMHSGDDEKFYEEIYKAIWGCLADKFNISLSKLSSETVQDCLNEKAVSEERQSIINDTLKEVDFARFAPGDSSQKKQSIYNKALDMIRTLSFVLALMLAMITTAAPQLPLDDTNYSETTETPERQVTHLTTDADAAFAEANAAYRAARYQDATEVYGLLIEQGYTSHELYYNYANALYRTAEFPKAILYYEKALRLKPGDKETRENLELANTKITNNITPVPKLFITRWHDKAVRNHTTNFWLIWIAVLTVLFAAAMVIFLRTQFYGLRKATFWVAVIAVVVMLPLIYTAIASNRYWNRPNEAIVMTTVINVKGSPDAGSVDKFELHSGTKVTIEDQIDRWLKIEAADGNTGWVKEEEVEKVI